MHIPVRRREDLQVMAHSASRGETSTAVKWQLDRAVARGPVVRLLKSRWWWA